MKDTENLGRRFTHAPLRRATGEKAKASPRTNQELHLKGRKRGLCSSSRPIFGRTSPWRVPAAQSPCTCALGQSDGGLRCPAEAPFGDAVQTPFRNLSTPSSGPRSSVSKLYQVRSALNASTMRLHQEYVTSSRVDQSVEGARLLISQSNIQWRCALARHLPTHAAHARPMPGWGIFRTRELPRARIREAAGDKALARKVTMQMSMGQARAVATAPRDSRLRLRSLLQTHRGDVLRRGNQLRAESRGERRETLQLLHSAGKDPQR